MSYSLCGALLLVSVGVGRRAFADTTGGQPTPSSGPSTDAMDLRSPMADQPAVRHRVLLRENRFEVAPLLGYALLMEYRNSLTFGVKAEYHFNDLWSVGGSVAFGAAKWNTGLSNQLLNTLQDTAPDSTDPLSPTRSQFREHLQDVQYTADLHATFTPFDGKLSVFGKTVFHYDFYVNAGIGFVGFTNRFQSPAGSMTDNDPRNDDPANAGTKVGPLLGAGMHVFFNHWVALNVEFRDTILFKNNPSGLDENFDRKVDSNDGHIDGIGYLGFGLAFFLPTNARISN
jgi:outer membrane beta-barrel protein